VSNQAQLDDPTYPQERLIACRNPVLATERARKREALLQATERELDAIVQATTRPTRRLTGQAAIALRVEKVRNRFKMGKHFQIAITDTQLRYTRDTPRITAEAALDGVYVVRTSVSAALLSAASTVGAYKYVKQIRMSYCCWLRSTYSSSAGHQGPCCFSHSSSSSRV
jgi:hypothetical protein